MDKSCEPLMFQDAKFALEDLEAGFEESGYNKLKEEGENLAAQWRSMLEPLFENAFWNPPVFVAPSQKLLKNGITTKNLGVYAKRDIVKGEVVTFYPTDILIIDIDGNCVNSFAHQGIPENIKFLKSIAKNPNNREFLQYSIKNRETLIVANPNMKLRPKYCGHYVNDCSKPKSLSKKDISEYLSDSKRNSNIYISRISKSQIGLIAKKPISKGEELFATYGPQYWKNVLLTEISRRKSLRLIC